MEGGGDEDALGGKSALKLFMLQAQRLDRATVEMSPPLDRSPFLSASLDWSVYDWLLLIIDHTQFPKYLFTQVEPDVSHPGATRGGHFYNNHTHLCFGVVFSFSFVWSVVFFFQVGTLMPWNIFINAKTVSYVRNWLLPKLCVTILQKDTVPCWSSL